MKTIRDFSRGPKVRQVLMVMVGGIIAFLKAFLTQKPISRFLKFGFIVFVDTFPENLFAARDRGVYGGGPNVYWYPRYYACPPLHNLRYGGRGRIPQNAEI